MQSTSLQDSGYSWFRLAISLVLATIGGIGLWVPVIILPVIQQEFGIDRAGASLPYTGTMVGFAVGGLLMGRLSDRFGIVVPLVLSGIMLAAGFFLAAWSPNYWVYVFAQSVPIGLLGCASTFGPLVADVSLWFRKRRGIAVAIVASGNYLAGAIWPPVITWITQIYGWRPAYACLGLVALIVMLPLAFLLRRRASLDEVPGSHQVRHDAEPAERHAILAGHAGTGGAGLLRGHVDAAGTSGRLLY